MATSWVFSDHVKAMAPEYAELASAMQNFTTIEHVLDWMVRSELSGARVDIVAQDEFTHDFLLEWKPETHWLSFGVT